MAGHVKTLGWIGVLRALLGSALGVWLILRAATVDSHPAAESWDALGFRVAGGFLLLLALVWLVQGIGAIRLRPWARRGGLFASVLDLCNLLGFPLFTALGLYGVVVYRSHDTRHFFASRDLSRSPAVPGG